MKPVAFSPQIRIVNLAASRKLIIINVRFLIIYTLLMFFNNRIYGVKKYSIFCFIVLNQIFKYLDTLQLGI